MKARGRLAAVSLLALASCAPNYPITPHAPAPPAAVAPQPAPAPAPAPPRTPIPRPDVSVNDSCGAAALQGLVGRPRSEIPVPVNPSRQRVACTKCPVTLDFNPGRLNFFFDAETGIIREVRCG
jgi:hypothetical protein